MCSRCGEPKKGHVCKIQPKYVRKDQPHENMTTGGAVQYSWIVLVESLAMDYILGWF